MSQLTPLKLLWFPAVLLAGLSLLSSPVHAQILSLPFSDFTGPTNADLTPFTQTHNGNTVGDGGTAYSITGGGALEMTINAGGFGSGFTFGNAAAAIVAPVTGLGSGSNQDFTISAVIDPQTYTSRAGSSDGPYTFGFTTLANNTFIYNGGTTGYYAYVNSNGVLNIALDATSNTTLDTTLTLVSSSNLPAALTLTTPYTLTLTGAYSGSTLTLDLTVTDGTSTGSLIATSASPYDGTNFGIEEYADYAGGSGQQLVADISNLSILPTAAVPEPSTWAVLLTGLGVLACASSRRCLVRSK